MTRSYRHKALTRDDFEHLQDRIQRMSQRLQQQERTIRELTQKNRSLASKNKKLKSQKNEMFTQIQQLDKRLARLDSLMCVTSSFEHLPTITLLLAQELREMYMVLMARTVHKLQLPQHYQNLCDQYVHLLGEVDRLHHALEKRDRTPVPPTSDEVRAMEGFGVSLEQLRAWAAAGYGPCPPYDNMDEWMAWVHVFMSKKQAQGGA